MPEKEKKKRKTDARKKKNNGNREFVLVTYFFVAIFVALILYICFFQFFRAETVINNSYNKRQNLFSATVTRGSIYSADGKVLAETIIDENGNEVRHYPYNEIFAHAVGYSTNGNTGVEAIGNFSLLRSNTSIFNKVYNFLYENKNPGDSVITTFDSELQKIAYEAMGDYDGAVVVMDPKTGEILTMVSKPDFDPNTIVTDYESIISEGENGETGSALYNRVTQGSYTPGSIFKIITTLEYVRQNTNHASYKFDCTGEVTVENVCIHCVNQTAHGPLNLTTAFARSCNCAFSTMGLTMDMDRFAKTCEQLYFNRPLPTQYPSTESVFAVDGKSNTAEIMRASFGQHTTTVSPWHMMLIVSAIANDGVLMKPKVIDRVVNDSDALVLEYKNEEYEVLLSQGEAKYLQECMRAGVELGSAQRLQSDIYTAYGKTGSAQVSDVNDDTHGWFVGYATDDEGNQIAIAVIVEKRGHGSTYAVPIAKKVFDYYFSED